MNINEAIKFLEGKIIDPNIGLPEEIFRFISRITPLINVDLLIKDEKGRTLLAWRNDEFFGEGWHIPGGIIRFKETFEKRIEKVAEKEIGTKIKFDSVPLEINQCIGNMKTRGHGLSILYKCFFSSKFILNNKGLNEKDQGFLKWHDSCPKNLIKGHEMYKKYLGGNFK